MELKELNQKVKTQNDINNLLIEKGDFDELYRQNQNLIYRLVRKYNCGIVEDYDEAISIANVAFSVAIKKYKPEVANFSTFLGLSIQSAFWHHARDQRSQKRNTNLIQFLYLDEPVGEKDRKNLTLQEVIKNDTISTEEKVENNIMIQNYIDYIKQQPKGEMYLKIIAFKYQDCTQKEIAKAIGVSQAHVSRILTSIGKCIKEYENSTQEKKKEGVNMEKIQQVKKYLKQGITNRQEIAKLLNISATSASTYISVAKRELELQKTKEEAKNDAPLIKQEAPKEEKVTVPVITEPEKNITQETTNQTAPIKVVEVEKEENILALDNTAAKNALSSTLHNKKERRRLHLSVVTSDYFNFAIESESVKITALASEDSIGLNVDLNVLPELIEDLKELEGYL